MSKKSLFFTFIVLIAYFLLIQSNQGKPPEFLSNLVPSIQEKPEQATPAASPKVEQNTELVIRVIDGDTIEISGGIKVRYIGINAPESTTKQECFGKEASAKNRALVEGKYITLEKDVSETDKYGRLLRYVYLGNKMINEQLVLEGFANASSYPPDIKYQDRFRLAEKKAREGNLGLWSGCKITSSPNSPNPQNPPTNNCLIKGNISASGEKIYHVPGGKFYDQTVIGDREGEQYFCTEEQAQTAGWRKSKL